MNTEEFKTVVEGAICDLISDESFAHVALRNWTDSLGNEEELYPYLAELIRRRLSCEVIGIGWGKYSNTNEKADCICHFKADSRKTTFAVELKGPSKDNAWVLNGFKKDLKKLNRLQEKGVIDYGIAIGIWLKDPSINPDNYLKILTLNSFSIGVTVSIKDTNGYQANQFC